ncbi:MAG: ankyrin repeat domain-containing protein [Candidatus Margulisbacteria bacterium]|nr:ankyrin repeat domain-containing protein [Candidatus Margulisiibacteriota bacterium]
MIKKIVSIFQYNLAHVKSVSDLVEVVRFGTLEQISECFDGVKSASSSVFVFNHDIKLLKFDGKTLLDLAKERGDEDVVLYVRSQILPGSLKTLFDFVTNSLKQKDFFNKILVASGEISMSLIVLYNNQYGVLPVKSHKEGLIKMHATLLILRDAFLEEDYSKVAIVLKQDPSVLAQKVNSKTFLSTFMGVWNCLPEIAEVVMGLVTPEEAEDVFKSLIREQAFGLQNTDKDVVRNLLRDPAFSALFSISFNSLAEAKTCVSTFVSTISDQELGCFFKPISLMALDADALAQFWALLSSYSDPVTSSFLLRKFDSKLYPKVTLILNSLRAYPELVFSVSSDGDVVLPLTRVQLNGVLKALPINNSDAVLSRYFPRCVLNEGVIWDGLNMVVKTIQGNLSQTERDMISSLSSLKEVFFGFAHKSNLQSILNIPGNKMELGLSCNQTVREAFFRKLFDGIGYHVSEVEIVQCLNVCGADGFVPVEKILSVMKTVQEQKMFSDYVKVLSALLSRPGLSLKRSDPDLEYFVSTRAIEHFSSTALLSSLNGSPANFKVLFELLMCSKISSPKVDKLLEDILFAVSSDSGHLLVFMDSLFTVSANDKSPFQGKVKSFLINNASNLLRKMSDLSRNSYGDYRLFHLLIREGNGGLEGFLQSFPEYIKRVANLRDAHGNTAFHVAAEVGNDVVLDYFYKFGIAHAELFWCNRAGETPLHLAVAKVKMVTLEKLMQLYSKHLQRKILQLTDTNGRTLLHAAVASTSGVVVADFKSKLNTCTGNDVLFAELALRADNQGNMPIHLVIKQSMEQTFDWLSAYYSKAVPRGLLQAAVLSTNTHLFRLITSKFPALNVNELIGKGDSALFVACKNNQFSVALELLKIGCKPEPDFLYKLLADKTLLTLKSACELFRPVDLRVCLEYMLSKDSSVMALCSSLKCPAGGAYLERYFKPKTQTK